MTSGAAETGEGTSAVDSDTSAADSDTSAADTSGATQGSDESGDEPVDFGPYPEGPYGFSVGDIFPPLTFLDPESEEVSMQDLRDGSRAVIVVHGWAPWCPPSNAYMAELEGAFTALGTAHLISPITENIVDSDSTPTVTDAVYVDSMYPDSWVVADTLELIEMGTLEDEDALFVGVGEVWMIDAETMEIGYADRWNPNSEEIGIMLDEHDACPPKVPCSEDDECGVLGPGTAGGGYVCDSYLGLCCQPQASFPGGECPEPFYASSGDEPICNFDCGAGQGCL